jgi:membrane protease YdiL (CAAX protease family)
MFTSMALSVVMGVFVLKSVLQNLEPTLPIACVWHAKSRGAAGNTGVSVAGTIAVIAASGVLFILSTWYLHNRNNQRWLKSIQVVGLVLLTAMGVGAAIRVVLLSQAFGKPNLELSDGGEREWSFGQLLPLLLLLLPVVSSVELWRGEMRVAQDVEDDRIPLTDGKGGMQNGFQPFPLQTSFFKR